MPADSTRKQFKCAKCGERTIIQLGAALAESASADHSDHATADHSDQLVGKIVAGVLGVTLVAIGTYLGVNGQFAAVAAVAVPALLGTIVVVAILVLSKRQRMVTENSASLAAFYSLNQNYQQRLKYPGPIVYNWEDRVNSKAMYDHYDFHKFFLATLAVLEDQILAQIAVRIENASVYAEYQAAYQQLGSTKFGRSTYEKMNREALARIEQKLLKREALARIEQKLLNREVFAWIEQKLLNREALARIEQKLLNREAFARIEQKLLNREALARIEQKLLNREAFARIEQKLFTKRKLSPPVCEAQVRCIVRYTTPKGQYAYARPHDWDFEQLRSGLTEMKQIQKAQSTAAFLRQQERNRMSDSLRYQVLKRDKSRCTRCEQ